MSAQDERAHFLSSLRPIRAEERTLFGTDDQGARRPSQQARLRWVIVALTILTTASVLDGHEVAGVVFLVGLVSVALAGQRSILANVPAAFLATLVLTIGAWSAASWLGLAIFSSEIADRSLMLCLALGAAVTALARRRQVTAATWSETVASLPALFLGGLGLLMSFRPVPLAANWMFTGGDNISHLLIAADVRHAGNLSYATDSYPRGWHALLATLIGASGAPTGGPRALLEFISISSLATWALYSLLTLAMSLCAHALIRATGAGDGAAALTGLATGMTLLTGGFFTFTMAFGFQTTILLAVVLAIPVYELVSGSSALRGLALASGVLVAVAHTWQLALPVALVPWAGAVIRVVKGELTRGRKWVCVGVAVSASLLLSSPPLWAAATRVGLQHAAVAGSIGHPPFAWLLASTIGAVLCLALATRRRQVVLLALITGTSLAMGLLVAAAAHTSITSYYPTKLIWHAATLSVPLVWTAIALMHRWRRMREGTFPFWFRWGAGLAGGVTMTAFCLIAVLTPLGAALGRWGGADATGVTTAVTRPDAPQAQLTWRVSDDPGRDHYALRILDFYSVGSGKPLTQDDPLDLEQACARLKASAHPAVLTTASQADVSRHFACVAGVRAISAVP